MTFCNDIDLLHWEPNILKEAAFASQTLISGTGDLAGTLFTIGSGSFASTHVTNDSAIVLGGSILGTFPIVAVNSAATQLTLSVLYDGLYPTSGGAVATSVGSATGIDFAIRTFWPQRRVVSELLLQAAGLDPTDDAAHTIVNPDSLKRACTLGTLHLIYSALAAAAEEPAALNARTDLYERLYRRALRCAAVEIDSDGDGRADCVRRLNVLRLERVDVVRGAMDAREGVMFSLWIIAEATGVENLTSFGAAGLMGAMWLWERRTNQKRESQIDEAHVRILGDRVQLEELMGVVRQNAEAIARLTVTQDQLLRQLGKEERAV